MENLKALFGRRLRELRREAGLTQQQLAKRAKLDDKHLGALERAEKSPSLEAIERLAKALETEPYLLLLPKQFDDSKLGKALAIVNVDFETIGHAQLRKFFKDLHEAVKVLEQTDRDEN